MFLQRDEIVIVSRQINAFDLTFWLHPVDEWKKSNRLLLEIKAGLCLSFSLLLRLVKQKADNFVDGAEYYDVMKRLNVVTDEWNVPN